MAIENGTAAGYKRFRLDVRADNAPAVRLYAALGFVRTAEAVNPKAGWTMLPMQYEHIS
jgi:ribosomal protein S18 acetylase RimI-like enzyme